jgi:hypothetical protein
MSGEYDDALQHAIDLCRRVESELNNKIGQAAARLCAKRIQRTLDRRNGSQADGGSEHGHEG